jgi:hypothetical protein
MKAFYLLTNYNKIIVRFVFVCIMWWWCVVGENLTRLRKHKHRAINELSYS